MPYFDIAPDDPVLEMQIPIDIYYDLLTASEVAERSLKDEVLVRLFQSLSSDVICEEECPPQYPQSADDNSIIRVAK